MGWSAVAPILLILINASCILVSSELTHSSLERSLKALEVSIRPESWVGEILDKSGHLHGRCSLQPTLTSEDGSDTEAQCNDSLSCVPVLTAAQKPSSHSILERTGMCIEFPPGKTIDGVKYQPSVYIFDSIQDKPLPIGYFPLTFKNLSSWPFLSFKGDLNGASFIDDEVFGSVLSCEQNGVELPTLPYAATGKFTVNFWMRADAANEGLSSGHIFSHKKLESGKNSQGGQQIQVSIPPASLGLHGVLRAAVKDATDTDNSPAVASFIDSDGEVGNNLERETAEDHVNVYDGNWHMITVTSKGADEKGFILYVDGAVAGELSSYTLQGSQPIKDIQITGGDPLDLDGPISLCGTASASPDDVFKGRLAHLALFDQSLSPEIIKDLFEILIVTQIQVDSIKNKTSTAKALTGNPCLLPAIYRGELVDTCVPREYTSECPTSVGVWEECSFFSNEDVDHFQILDVDNDTDDGGLLFTVDGDACEMPMYYGGISHTECVELHGQPSCQTKGGIWKECATSSPQAVPAVLDSSKISRTTIHGQECIFPFTYKGEVFDDCTDVYGDWSCRIVTGEYFPCAIERNPATLYRKNSTAPLISRITTGGEKCVFPLWYGEESIADCFPEAGGVLSCPISAGEIQPCAPLRLTINGNPCAFPFYFEGEVHYDCVEHDDHSVCMTADGSIDQCAAYSSLPQPYKRMQGLHITPSRATVGDGVCAFPYWYGGKLVSDCVLEDGVERCQTADGFWEECQPVILTEDDKQCSVPFHHEEEFHFDCIVMDGSYKCPTALDEPWGECKGYSYFAPGAEPSSEFDELEEGSSLEDLDILDEEDAFEVPRIESTRDHSVGQGQDDLHFQSWTGELTGAPGKEIGECRLPEAYSAVMTHKNHSKCSSNSLSCIPVRSLLNSTATERKGACFKFPGDTDSSAAYIFDAANEMPVPQGYFPLTGNRVDSWPFDHMKGKANGPNFVTDEVFGSVLQCSEGTVQLPSLPYAASGHFSVNMWLKAEKPTAGIGFEYIFSHMQKGATAGLRGSSQIQLYLPRKAIPSHGILRAVVKDKDDKDDGRASDSFIDSDGQIGNNLGREFGSDHTDFYDGQWHMVTVTSRAGATEGFKLYIDGVLAGEMGAEQVNVKDGHNTIELQVTGGGPVDLSGKIHLCGRAVDSKQRYFKGRLAHLGVFDNPLSAEHVRELFETYFVTKAQSQGRSQDQTGVQTISGDTCLFPALFRGNWIDMCTNIDGIEKCPSGPGKWVECASSNSKPASKFVTIDNEPCQLPVFYNGALHKECIKIAGKPMCHTSGGPWKECRSISQNPVDRWDPPSWEEHRGTREFDLEKQKEIMAMGQTDNREHSTHELSKDILKHDGPFETIDGEECQLPVFYAGELHNRCVPIDGIPMCHAPAGPWKECRVKLREDEERQKDAREDEDVLQGKNEIEDEGKKQKEDAAIDEELTNGVIDEEEEDSTSRETSEPAKDRIQAVEPSLDVITAARPITRVTVDGDQCFFPYWYGEESISGCVMMEGKQICPTNNGAIKECAPVRSTVDGVPCALPFAHKGKQHSDCLEIKGAEHCKTAAGELRRCAPAPEQPTKVDEYEVVTSRATIKGANCALPFWYKGKLVSDCVPAGGSEYCRTMLGEWEECTPQIFTVDGKKCSIPFQYEGKNYFDCAKLDGVSKCPTAALEAWGECARDKAVSGRSSTG